MTENSGGLMTATTVADIEQSRADPAILGTVGRALPGYQVRSEDGELLVRGPGIVPGYWRRTEANATAFTGGWFRTGDAGHVDEHGRVVVSERRTDLIVSGGMNVYPAEVEHVIGTLPDVAECAVVGLPHERWGQTVVVAVVRQPGSRISGLTSLTPAAAGWPATRSRPASCSSTSCRGRPPSRSQGRPCAPG